ncbi:MAG: ATP-binding protein [Fidelibacterota bacterium]
MIQDKLIGQEKIWERLLAAYESNHIAGAYLFHGSAGVGKEGMAIRFAALLNCTADGYYPCGNCSSCVKFNSLQHPNLTLIYPLPKDKEINKGDSPLKALKDETIAAVVEQIKLKSNDPYIKVRLPRSNTILINSIREVREKIYLKAIEVGRKVVLIFDADLLMTGEGSSANALLKILEEPPPDSTFILTTDYPERLVETISSRCQQVFFPPVPVAVIEDYLRSSTGKPAEEARLIAHLAQGNVRMAKHLLNEDLSEVQDLLESLVVWMTDRTEKSWRSFTHHAAETFWTNPQELNFHFQLLSYWFRDAQLIKKMNGNAVIILEGMEERLRKFVAQYPRGDFARIVQVLETCFGALARNYNLNLVITNLLFDIQDSLQGTAK